MPVKWGHQRIQMKIIFFLLFALLITACLETLEVASSKEAIAQKKIQNNKSEALRAQENYIKLQRQRKND